MKKYHSARTQALERTKRDRAMKIVRSFFAQIFGGVKYIMYLCRHENETPVSLKSIFERDGCSTSSITLLLTKTTNQ